MQLRQKLLFVCAAFLALAWPCAAQKPMRSPWDFNKVKVTSAPYGCPAPIHLSPDLTTNSFYSDSKGSIIDPVKWKAYQESSGPVKQDGQNAVDAADAFQSTGSRQAAQCVLTILNTAAQDKALTGKMSSSQSYFVQGWITGAMAIALLKVRNSGVVHPADTKFITDWMKTVTQQEIDYYNDRLTKNPAGQNHLYWAGVQVGAVAIAANDRKYFDWARMAYGTGIKEISPEGTLSEEMRRGQRALHYHLYAASPLVYIAEFGELNGIDLYAEGNGALKRLIDISIKGLEGSSYFDTATGIKQDLPDGPPSAEAIGWAKVYVHRFPDPDIQRLLAQAPSLSYNYLGGLPPYL
jgi:poly(beta-D-mannuronate) lyase